MELHSVLLFFFAVFFLIFARAFHFFELRLVLLVDFISSIESLDQVDFHRASLLRLVEFQALIGIWIFFLELVNLFPAIVQPENLFLFLSLQRMPFA